MLDAAAVVELSSAAVAVGRIVLCVVFETDCETFVAGIIVVAAVVVADSAWIVVVPICDEPEAVVVTGGAAELVSAVFDGLPDDEIVG